jgi:hypothetical protein
MIARIWRGRVRSGLLSEYRGYIAKTGLADYQATPGNRGAYMLTRDCDGYGEVITFSLWDDLQSIVAFAGDDVTLARYYPEDQRFLLDFPERVEHYDVTRAEITP